MQTLVPCNVTRSTKLRRVQCAPELALRSTEFRSPENLIFPAVNMCIVIICSTLCNVINFQIKLIKSFSYMTKKLRTKGAFKVT